jgi:8-oxo-dGTP diphosphatase
MARRLVAIVHFSPGAGFESRGDSHKIGGVRSRLERKSHMSDHSSLRISCAAIVDNRRRTLLVRKANTDFYMQPGGKIEQDESSLDCLKRELMEELGVAFSDEQMEFVGHFSEIAANERNVTVQADVHFIEHTFQPRASSEIAEFIWLDASEDERDDLAPLTKNVVLGLVKEYRARQGK